MGEVLRLVEFLAEANWELFLTPKDGNCLYGAFRRGMELPDEFRNQHLRNQLVFFAVKHHKYFYDLLKLDILIEYGQKRISKEEFERRDGSQEEPLTDEEREAYNKPGPFSFYSYLTAVLDSGFWGDTITINIISRMWQVAITIVGAEHLSLTRIRHRRDLENTHFILILAGGSHYLGACKYQFYILIVGSSVRRCAAMVYLRAAMARCCAAMVSVPLCVRVPGSTGDLLTRCAGMVPFCAAMAVVVRRWSENVRRPLFVPILHPKNCFYFVNFFHLFLRQETGGAW